MKSRNQQEALYELLVHEFAEGFSGLDDDMVEATDDWISELSDGDIAEICIRTFQKGI